MRDYRIWPMSGRLRTSIRLCQRQIGRVSLVERRVLVAHQRPELRHDLPHVLGGGELDVCLTADPLFATRTRGDNQRAARRAVFLHAARARISLGTFGPPDIVSPPVAAALGGTRLAASATALHQFAGRAAGELPLVPQIEAA